MRPLLSLLPALALAACATVPQPSAPVPAATAPAAAVVPGSMQWLYGSGEGGVASLQAFRAFEAHVAAAAAARPRDSVILSAASTLERPLFEPCGDRPLAVILDVDETAIQNLGYEYDEARRRRSYDPDIWARWEETGARHVAPMPGAVEAVRAARAAGVTVIFNSNRLTRFAAATEAALAQAGLGPARHGETLFLKGDAPGGSDKDSRRAIIAGRYCVVAMAGDQLGDFSDLFNRPGLGVADRRRAALAAPLASLWGRGWFLLSNPVYGSGLKGDFDDVFPPETRWTDPAGDE